MGPPKWQIQIQSVSSHKFHINQLPRVVFTNQLSKVQLFFLSIFYFKIQQLPQEKVKITKNEINVKKNSSNILYVHNFILFKQVLKFFNFFLSLNPCQLIPRNYVVIYN
jgi:hypothetical protein